MLNNYKSHIFGFLIIVVSALYANGIITEDFQTTLVGILTGGSVMALRSAITRVVSTILKELVSQGKAEAERRISVLEKKIADLEVGNVDSPKK